MEFMMVKSIGKKLLPLLFLIGQPIYSLQADPKIAPNAIGTITQKSYPKTFAEWGESGVKEINELIPLAAKKAASSPECDVVKLVELSSNRSAPGKAIVFFVDCANGKRFYLGKEDLMSKTVIQSESEKMAAISDARALETCVSAIKDKLENPLSFNRDNQRTSFRRVPITGNIVVEFIFEAKNNLGAILPRKAYCAITDRSVDASISKQ
jgi:hypothetical protein